MTLKQYFSDSRRLTVGVLAIAPLLLLYEAGILAANPGVRNGADASLRRAFALLGAIGEWVWIGCLLLALVLCALAAYRERIPAHRMLLPTALEGFVYALAFGPLVLLLRHHLGPQGYFFREHFAAAGPALSGDFLNLVLAVGAGVYEEVLFRLLLLSALYFLGKKICEFLALPSWLAAIGAVALSALAFSAFHHVGEFAAPFTWEAFAFRTLAGAILGGIFIGRGFGVAVYTHAFYDILYLFSP